MDGRADRRRQARTRSRARRRQVAFDNLLDIGLAQFPLDRLKTKIEAIERELIDGRGFVRIRTLDTKKYSDDDLTMLYWGIGIHLGDPWPQNHYGHVMGDVTDQGKRARRSDAARQRDRAGRPRLSHRRRRHHRPDVPAQGQDRRALLRRQRRCDLQRTGADAARPGRALYERAALRCARRTGAGPQAVLHFPVFTEHKDRLFIRFIPQYILASQKHPEAPRLSPTAHEALKTVTEMARDPRYNVYMDLAPGEMQFINNYHVLHGRQEYQDDVATGYKRHLKRLWLATRYLKERPDHFRRKVQSHWGKNISVSKIKAVEKPN